ncbi:uncharacterized protein ARMOST_10162 [Armillaria ostoyae]|uniref:Uncharacterized protein n=1 Tax=Armillaria ostoyae TaxID=47428 RepID=A0A284RDJ0_ARMOS|nr:uncharacterized protein ARMOST_10162 [Armillaria ostoyae]
MAEGISQKPRVYSIPFRRLPSLFPSLPRHFVFPHAGHHSQAAQSFPAGNLGRILPRDDVSTSGEQDQRGGLLVGGEGLGGVRREQHDGHTRGSHRSKMSTPTDLDLVLHFLMSLPCIKRSDFKGVCSWIEVTEVPRYFLNISRPRRQPIFAPTQRIAFWRVRWRDREPAFGLSRRPFRCGESPPPRRAQRRNQVLARDDVSPSGEHGWRVGAVLGLFGEPFGFAAESRPFILLRRIFLQPDHPHHTATFIGTKFCGDTAGGRRSADHPKPAHRGMSVLGLQRTPPAHHPFFPRLKTSSGLGDLWSARQSARRGVNQRMPLFTPVEPVAAD